MMSIVTKTGDEGQTSLMFNRRVSKHDLRVDAYGALDEFNAAAGMLRARLGPDDTCGKTLLTMQRDLIALMGEVSTPADAFERYVASGYARLEQAAVQRIEERVVELESCLGPFHDWCLPGGSSEGALADWARVVCRRAERLVCAVHAQEPLANPLILVFLNRLSDWLWLEARRFDQAHADANS